jgi:RimJ/RimL family protein N-acetyltransferase
MVYLRKATSDDLDILFKWANDYDVRKNAFNSEPIPYENHKKWFYNMMENDDIIQYILMDDNISVGQIRLDIDECYAEIDYSVDKRFRNKGYGHKLLQLIFDEVNANYPEIKKLIAKVKPDNPASKKIFESEGYHMVYTCYDMNLSDYGVEN